MAETILETKYGEKVLKKCKLGQRKVEESTIQIFHSHFQPSDHNNLAPTTSTIELREPLLLT